MAATDTPSTSPSTVPETVYVPPEDPSKPRTPSQLHARTWFGVLKRSVRGFSKDNCTDWAAALTYYGVLSLFPGAIVLVALVGLFGDGQRAVDTILGLLKDLGAGTAVEGLQGPIQQVVAQKSAASTLLGVGALAAVWTASGYVGAFSRATNVVYGVTEGRPFWKLRPIQLVITAVALVTVAVIVLGLLVSGPVAEAIGEVVGAGDVAVAIWQFGKWPVLLVIASLLLSVLYWVSPNVKQPRFRWFTIGGTLALVAWAAASVGFALYVTNFGSYNATYGSLGAVIVFLVWLYITNCAILLGAEINAELERGRELQAGYPAEDQLLLPPRNPAKEDEPVIVKGERPAR
jgi:membrane protein